MGMKTIEMTARLKSVAGITLTEMMVVVAILGVLTAFAVPEYLACNSKAKLRDATALVAGNINLARVGAINQGTIVTVTVCYQTAACPGAAVNPTPNRVTVFFRNPTGTDLLPVETLNPLIALTDASNNPLPPVASPQDVQFSPVGIRRFTGTNANNLCVSNTGAYVGCAVGNAQVFNFKNTDRNLNYRVVIGPSGKTTWCYSATCAGL
jgi:prepilin-type N-terminal cleavage/methylation domain-containing protein